MSAGLPASLHRDGRPVEGLYPGWQPGTRHHGPAGLDALLLHGRESGRKACWWLSAEDELLACHALALPPQWCEALMAALGPALAEVSLSLLEGVNPLPAAGTPQPAPLLQLAGLPLIARLQLLSLWFRQAQADLHILSPAALMAHGLPRQEDTPQAQAPQDTQDMTGDTARPFSAALVENLLGTRPAGPHTLACSPFTGRILRAGLTMPTTRGIACRFTDDEAGDGQTFYLFWPAPAGRSVPAGGQVPLFYHPGRNLVVGEGTFTPLVPLFLLSWFISHPGCIEALEAARPFHLEDYGVGHASALWSNLVPEEGRPDEGQAEEAGQMLSSFPFSRSFWGAASPLQKQEDPPPPAREDGRADHHARHIPQRSRDDHGRTRN